MSNTINLVVHTTAIPNDRLPSATPQTDAGIAAEARRRLISDHQKAQAAAAAAREKEQRDLAEAEARIREERIKLRAEEEMVSLMARRLTIEAEAKAAAEKREAAIKAEMERLRNRTPLEILEDKVTALTEALSGLDPVRLAEIRSRF
jgi:hypothetical protein